MLLGTELLEGSITPYDHIHIVGAVSPWCLDVPNWGNLRGNDDLICLPALHSLHIFPSSAKVD